MKRLTKKALSVILSILMVITVIPASVLPAVAEESATSDTLLEVGRIAYAVGADNSYNEYTVKTNKTDGNIVIVFKPERNNWQTAGNNLLSVNGVSVISHAGGGGYNLGSTSVAANFTARDITVTINVPTGKATIVDTAGNSGTAYVGPIVEDFTLKINQKYTNSWELTSVVVTQDKGKALGTPDTNNFDSADDVARGVCGTTVSYNDTQSALHLTCDGSWNYANAYWETSVNVNGTDGMIILKTTIDASAAQTAKTADGSTGRGTGAILTVNGKVVIQNSVVLDESNQYTVTLGGKTEIKGCGNGIEVVTLIINPETGVATMYFDQTAANSADPSYPKMTVVEGIELGKIEETVSVRYGSNRHPNFYVYNLSAQQYVGKNIAPTKLYTNNFDSAEDVTQGVCGDTAIVTYNSEKSVLHLTHASYHYENSYWEDSVSLNGTDGLITIKTTIDASAEETSEGSDMRGTGAILTINGVVVVQNSVKSDNSNKYTITLGGKKEIKGCKAGTEKVTLVIDPETGKTTMTFEQSATDVPQTTVVEDIALGDIGETITVRYGTNRHPNFYVYSLSVAQYVGEVIEDGEGEGSDEPDPNTLYTNNFDSAEDVARGTCGNENTVYNENKSALHISFCLSDKGEPDYSNAYWETSVKTNGTDGLITLKTTIDADANSHPAAAKATGAILTVNGQVVIKNKEGGKFVTLRDGTEIKGCAANYIEEISLIINPENGRATLIFDQTAANAVDGSYPKTVVVENVALGAIGETFSVRYGTNRHANFYVYSLSVSQESGGGYDMHTCEYTTTVTDATCTTPEFTKTECLECGLFTEPVTAPVLGHKWGNWSKNDGVATRSCSVCGASQSKTVKDVDTTKPLLAFGDSLTFGLNTPNTINDSWAKYVANNLGVSSYENYAVDGTAVYQWYSLLTGEKAPNNKPTAEIAGLTKDTLTEKIKNAGVVAFSLGSNDLIGGYVGHRSAEKVHETLIKIVDKIHEINPDAIVVSVGYAYGVSMVVGGKYEPSYELFIDFNDLMTETLNSEAYNSFAYYVDVSNVMSDVTLLGEDKIHPTAEGQKKIADRAIKATDALNKPDTFVWEGIPTYVNHFDGTAPTAAVVSWGETGTDGVLTVAPSIDKNENQLSVGSVAFPGKSVITFKFNIPKLPESGSINIFHDRALEQDYICVFSAVNEETQETEFWASVGNNNDGNSSVRIEENTWYNVTILFAENVDSFSKVYVNNTFVGTVKGNIIGRGATWGFANFSGCDASGNENAADYQIDDFTASAVADEAIVRACGTQRTETLEMKYDVRFVFSVKDIYSDESQIGMDVVVDYGDESKTKNDIQTNIVFEQIEDNYGKETKTAAELGGKYIATIIVDDVPADYPCVKFVVSPYALINGVKYYADTMTATLYSQK